jgi:hypothetical protein
VTTKTTPWRDLPEEEAAIAREEFLARPLTHIPKDVVVLFDRNARLQRQLNLATWKIWTLMLVVGGEGAVIRWLFKFVLAHVR